MIIDVLGISTHLRFPVTNNLIYNAVAEELQIIDGAVRHVFRNVAVKNIDFNAVTLSALSVADAPEEHTLIIRFR